MKKIFCVLICSVMIFTAYSYNIYADSMEEIDSVTVSLASAPLVSYSANTFVEDQIYSQNYSFSFTVGFATIETEGTLYYKCVYLSVPFTDNYVEAYEFLSDFDDETKMYLDILMSQYYPEAELSSSPSHYYNCHSYAWHSEDVDTNCYWIDNPENYYLNNTYYMEVTTPAAGDIICYFDGDENIHSGVVTSINSFNNTVRVVSKWGYWGLYEHKSNECPYVLNDNGVPTTIKYYRFHDHTFTYTRNIMNPSVHTARCSTCGYSFEEYHNHRQLPDGSTRCSKCGYVSIGNIIMSESAKPIGE